MWQTINLDQHVVIEASAGTGKTFTIERLVVRLITERRVPLAQILVVTFTEKATGELKDRLRSALDRELISAKWPAEVVSLLRAALDGFDDAPIFTIHGFCNQVLRQYAFENRQPFNVDMVDDRSLRESRFTDVMRRQWDFGKEREQELQNLLAAADFPGIGFGSKTWATPILDLAGRYRPQGGDVLLPTVTDFQKDDAATNAEAIAIAAGLTHRVGPIDPNDFTKNAFYRGYEKLNINASSRRSRLESVILPILKWLAAPHEQAAFLPSFQAMVETCGKYSGFKSLGFKTLVDLKFLKAGDNRPDCPNLDDICSRLVKLYELHLRRIDSLAAYSIVTVQKNVAAYKQERGLISYDDMIVFLDAALDEKRNPAGAGLLLDALQKRFRYGLVDEFQDTDPIQWAIFRRLFVESKEGHRLIVVGDPKQAIYGFRSADLRAYQEAKDVLMKQYGANSYPLDVNYRSMPELIAGMNALFSKNNWFTVQQDPSPALQCPAIGEPPTERRRTRLLADGSKRAPITFVELPMVLHPKSVAGECQPIYAKFVAREIERLLHGGPGRTPLMEIGDGDRAVPLGPQHICVLVQKKSEIPGYERAFRRLGLPHSWYKKPRLWDSDEALQFETVMRAIADPSDASAARKALLTRFFRVPLETGGYGPIAPAQLERYDDLPPSHPARQALARWQESARRRDWAALFRELLHETGLMFDEVRAADGSRRMSNHSQITEQLITIATSQGLDVRGVLELVENYRRKFVDMDEDVDLHRLESMEAQISILTMHTSKGLEFPVVFVAGFGDFPESSFLKYHDSAGRIVYDLRTTSAMKTQADAEQSAECRRLYYVACTRAMHKLYLPWYPPVPTGSTRYRGSEAINLFTQAGEACIGKDGPIRKVVLKDGDAVPDDGPPWVPALDSRPRTKQNVITADAPPAIPPDLPKAPGPFFATPLLSFSTLAHVHGPEIEAAIEDEDEAEQDRYDEEEHEGQDDAVVSEPDEQFPLPGGMEGGTLIHEILEQIDFREVANAASPEDLLAGPAGEVIRERLEYHYPSAARDAEWRNSRGGACVKLLFCTLRAELPGVGRLCDVPAADRLTELEFHFPTVRHSDSAAGDLTHEATLLEDVHVAANGYVTGFIDMVFRIGKKFYVLDWKTNYLADGYGPSELVQAMSDSRYDLQRDVYATAVSRWLEQWSHGAAPVPEFGGAFYLFLRGMVASDTAGICFAGPDALAGHEQRVADVVAKWRGR